MFCVKDGTLFFADWSTVGTGGEVVAVDLSSGKEVWRANLDALGNISHFGYSNRIRMEYRRDAVWVLGKESFGNYVEVKDPETGKTVAHRVFDKEERLEKTPE